MLALVQFLAAPPYASSLFAYTSHDKLCLSRVANFIFHDSELQIQFNPRVQRFTFAYIQSPSDWFPWSQTCLPDEWRPVLERILQKRLGWFHGS